MTAQSAQCNFIKNRSTNIVGIGYKPMSNQTTKLTQRKEFRLSIEENRKLEYHSKLKNQTESDFLRDYIQSLSDPPFDPMEEKLIQEIPQEISNTIESNSNS